MAESAQHDLEKALWPADHPSPSRIITCRSCGRKNRVRVSVAALYPEKYRCGSCDHLLFLGVDEPLTGIVSSAYEHELDRKSLATLKAVPGFPALVKWVIANVGERTLRIQQMSSSIRCNDSQFPELLRLLDLARQRLDIHDTPVLYLSESPRMNAATAGVENAAIIVWSAILDQLDDGELVSIFAHELGHLHANHLLYKTMARLVVEGTGLLGGYVRFLTIPLRKALLLWDRCSELTADRAALLGSRSLEASLTTFLKLAGGNRPGIARRTTLRLEPFIEQARELAEIEASSWLDNALATLMTLDLTHPYIVWRLMHLLEWVEQGNYLDIMAGNYARSLDD